MLKRKTIYALVDPDGKLKTGYGVELNDLTMLGRLT